MKKRVRWHRLQPVIVGFGTLTEVCANFFRGIFHERGQKNAERTSNRRFCPILVRYGHCAVRLRRTMKSSVEMVSPWKVKQL